MGESDPVPSSFCTISGATAETSTVPSGEAVYTSPRQVCRTEVTAESASASLIGPSGHASNTRRGRETYGETAPPDALLQAQAASQLPRCGRCESGSRLAQQQIAPLVVSGAPASDHGPSDYSRG